MSSYKKDKTEIEKILLKVNIVVIYKYRYIKHRDMTYVVDAYVT